MCVSRESRSVRATVSLVVARRLGIALPLGIGRYYRVYLFRSAYSDNQTRDSRGFGTAAAGEPKLSAPAEGEPERSRCRQAHVIIAA